MQNDEIYQNEFIWNLDKKALNLADHKVTFEMGAEATKDPFAIEYYDAANSIFEDRYNVVGLYQGSRLLTVSLTYRELKRIFAVRAAQPEGFAPLPTRSPLLSGTACSIYQSTTLRLLFYCRRPRRGGKGD